MTPNDLDSALAEIQRLRILVEASKMINSSIEGQALYQSILSVVRAELGVERGTLYLYDAAAQEIRADIEGEGGLTQIRLAVGQGLAGSVAATGESIVINDAYADPRFERKLDLQSGFRTRSLLCAPIRNRFGHLVGVLQLVNKIGGDFGDVDLRFLESLSDHMAIAIENARYHVELVRREKLDRDLQLAREIQRGLLPSIPRDWEGIDIAARWVTSLDVGGDYFDFFRFENGDRGFVIADVSGKGVAAALVMSSVQAALRASVRLEDDLLELTTEINSVLHEMTHGRKYATMFVARWSPRTRMLRYVNAGHCPALVASSQGVSRIDSTGMPVGLMPAARFREGSTELLPGSTLVLYTDGITEAVDPSEEDEFGTTRLMEVVGRAHRTPDDLATAIIDAVAVHEAGEPPVDDKTIIALRFR
jgi:sigma-B regulation protein RsbU (phosphoserine phosphatase)